MFWKKKRPLPDADNQNYAASVENAIAGNTQIGANEADENSEVKIPFAGFYQNYLSKLVSNEYLQNIFFEAGKIARDNRKEYVIITNDEYKQFVRHIEAEEAEEREYKESSARLDRIFVERRERKIRDAAEWAIPVVNNRLDELKKYNKAFESAPTPEILSNCLEAMELHIQWFVEQEEEYPTAPWLMAGGGKQMRINLKNRYNELLYSLVNRAFVSYKTKITELVLDDNKQKETEIILTDIDNIRRYIDTGAGNYKEIFDNLNELHFQVEEIFSNLIN